MNISFIINKNVKVAKDHGKSYIKVRPLLVNHLQCNRLLEPFIQCWCIVSLRNEVYNIPRACLLNISSVPAMDLKYNRSGLWRHMLETCRRLRRLCRKHSNNVARHDKTPVKSALLSRDMSFMSRRSDIMLWLLYI